MGQGELSSVGSGRPRASPCSGRKPTILPGHRLPSNPSFHARYTAHSRSTDSENALDLIDTSTLPGRLLVLWMIFVRVTSAHGKSGVVGHPQRRVDLSRPCRSGA